MTYKAKPKAPWVSLAEQGRAMMPNGGLRQKQDPKRIARRTKVRAAEDRIYLRRSRIFLAAHLRCEVFPHLQSNQTHHHRGRLGPLLVDERGFHAVSQEGQTWIHSHIEEARELGLICEKGDWGRPF
jgi:hypothetical protein